MYGNFWNMKYRLMIFNEVVGISTIFVNAKRKVWLETTALYFVKICVNKIRKHILSITESSISLVSRQHPDFFFFFFFFFFENGNKQYALKTDFLKAYARVYLRQTFFLGLILSECFTCGRFDWPYRLSHHSINDWLWLTAHTSRGSGRRVAIFTRNSLKLYLKS